MIHTSNQLKALVRNRSNGDSNKAQIIIRYYVMERFLERLSLSKYRDNLILKGGALISSMVGLETRSTMDIDATVKHIPLTVEQAQDVVAEIASIHIDDGMTFEVISADTIMDEAEYSGVRVILNTLLENMKTPLKIDFSTGDAITPREVCYSYPLLFEERKLSLMAYPIETVLAEKLETILSRGIANTRTRDFYDIYILNCADCASIQYDTLKAALMNTCNKRGSAAVIAEAKHTITALAENQEMQKLWANYQRRFEYAKAVDWSETIRLLREICHRIDLIRDGE